MIAAMALSFTLRRPACEPAAAAPDRGRAGDRLRSPTAYLAIRYAGMILMFAFMAIQAMLQAVGEVRFAMRVQIASLVFNAALDPLLILGFGPAPRAEGERRG